MNYKYMVLDVEGDQKKGCYQIGFAIYNAKTKKVLNSNFYNIAEKLSCYSQDIQDRIDVQNQEHTTNIVTSAMNILEVLEKYKIKRIYTYNLFADKNTISSTFGIGFYEYLSLKYEMVDLMSLTVTHIVKTKKYIKNPNNYNVDSKRKDIPKYSVSTVYTYLTDSKPNIPIHNSENDSLLEVVILEWLHHHRRLNRKKERIYNSPQHIMNSIRKYVRENREKQV